MMGAACTCNSKPKPEEKRRVEESILENLKKECLLVEEVDLHLQDNADEHHTDSFECVDRKDDPQLVVRRGQEFKMTLTFQRPWKSDVDDLYLVFKIGEEPNPQKGTYAKVKLEEGDDTSYMDNEDKTWGARIVEQKDNALTISVYPPPDVIIGEWEYAIRTIKGGKGETYEKEGDNDVIILLNPWCKDDQVYMEKSQDLDEYVNNEIGLAFTGSHSRIRSRPWNYGHFQEGILESCLHILRKANDYAVSAQMNDPIYIARALSRILNDIDDNGVLSGRWDGNYEDGIKPTSWKGSAPIIRRYMESKQPVKYGQCWVFSHLFTAVARALGLPCRSVTNFSSAHDTDLTMTIDKYVDDEGDEIDYKNGDSVWNFHVWNEVWILRPDLDRRLEAKGKYDGWHAVDATPQELSDSVFQCGPTPLSAIRNGEVDVGYDTKFVFAEVNADRCTWKDGDPPTLLKRETNSVGKKMSTKFPNGSTVGHYTGKDDGVRLDVTDLYKYEEDSPEERAAVEKAVRKGKLGKLLFENDTGVKISVEELETPKVGEDFTVKVKVENVSDEERSVRVRTAVKPTNYWGGSIGKEKIAVQHDGDTIEAKDSKTYELHIDADDYLRLCDDDLSMRVLAFAWVQDVEDPLFASDDIVIRNAHVKCEGPPGKVAVGKLFDVKLTFYNPLKKKPLTKCKLVLEGLVLADGDGFKHRLGAYIKDIQDLKPGEKRTLKVKAKAGPKPSTKHRELAVGLSSNELPDMVGSLSVKLE